MLEARVVLRLATRDASAATMVGHQAGNLAPGKLADVLILDAEPCELGAADLSNHAVYRAPARNLHTILVAGEIASRCRTGPRRRRADVSAADGVLAAPNELAYAATGLPAACIASVVAVVGGAIDGAPARSAA